TSPQVPTKNGPMKFTLTAAPDAKGANQPLRILLLSTDPAHPFARRATFDIAAKETNPDLLIPKHDSPWLTVIGAPPPTHPTTQPLVATSESEKPKKKKSK